MTLSKSIHVAANGIILFFLWLSNIPLYTLSIVFSIHSSVNGHLGGFHVLAIVNSAAMNTGVQVSFQITAFFEHMPRRGITGSYGKGVVLNEHFESTLYRSFLHLRAE